MKLASLARLYSGLMLGLTFSGIALTLWSADRATYMTHRINLAQQSYATHLHLSSQVWQLTKQFGDALLIGDRDGGTGETALIAAIREDLTAIRHIIEAEISLVGASEVEELESLAQIDTALRRMIAEMKRLATMVDHHDADDSAQLAAFLDGTINGEFRAMLETALAGEALEMSETDARATAHALLSRRLALLLLGFAVLIPALGLLHYRAKVARPLRRLLTGVQAIATGQFDAPIALTGGSEIAEIARVLDDMAVQVGARTRSLSDQNAALEQAVAARTRSLERLLGDAKVAEDSRRQMLADVSHELRTPLTIIRGESEVALRGAEKTPAEYREALTRARDAASHTAQLVDDLLFIAREEMGRVRLSLERCDLRALTIEAVALVDPKIHVFSDLQPAPIEADPLRLRQAVIALVQNARLHGGDEVRVRLLRVPRGYCVSVEDNGPGLSDDDRAHAFKRFFRGPNAAETHAAGTGLGLPVVLSIAQAHGGTARLDARPGGGTVAVIELPPSAPSAKGSHP